MRRRTSASTPAADRAARTAAAQFAADVQYYLMQDPRQLPSRYLYDALGSALFEAICELPWYRITRAEQRLLAAHGAEILRQVAPASTIVELGSGSGLPAGSHPVVTYRGRVSGTTTGWFDPNTRQLLKTSVDASFGFTMVFHGMPGGSVPNGTAMSFRGAMLVSLQKA